RANYIIVSKCPENLSEKDKNGFIKKINPNEEQQVFFSCIRYDNKLKEELKDKKIVLITGIDNPKPLKEYIESFCEIHQMMKFPDHYSFSHEEKERFASLSLPIVTTEKDFSRLRDLKDKIYVQKISAEVNGNFIGLLKKDIENKLRHNNQKN
ncbi:MAG: tetraacyldisaccharide 4'-kinase, partial [Bacteroidales bacterium]|nr:tetraacyldisaccharide 4'-kinase [Bacteroidales bacterium]